MRRCLSSWSSSSRLLRAARGGSAWQRCLARGDLSRAGRQCPLPQRAHTQPRTRVCHAHQPRDPQVSRHPKRRRAAQLHQAVGDVHAQVGGGLRELQLLLIRQPLLLVLLCGRRQAGRGSRQALAAGRPWQQAGRGGRSRSDDAARPGPARPLRCAPPCSPPGTRMSAAGRHPCPWWLDLRRAARACGARGCTACLRPHALPLAATTTLRGVRQWARGSWLLYTGSEPVRPTLERAGTTCLELSPAAGAQAAGMGSQGGVGSRGACASLTNITPVPAPRAPWPRARALASVGHTAHSTTAAAAIARLQQWPSSRPLPRLAAAAHARCFRLCWVLSHSQAPCPILFSPFNCVAFTCPWPASAPPPQPAPRPRNPWRPP